MGCNLFPNAFYFPSLLISHRVFNSNLVLGFTYFWENIKLMLNSSGENVAKKQGVMRPLFSCCKHKTVFALWKSAEIIWNRQWQVNVILECEVLLCVVGFIALITSQEYLFSYFTFDPINVQTFDLDTLKCTNHCSQSLTQPMKSIV